MWMLPRQKLDTKNYSNWKVHGTVPTYLVYIDLLPNLLFAICAIYSDLKVIGTLRETNIADENRPLEKEIPIGNQHFHGLC